MGALQLTTCLVIAGWNMLKALKEKRASASVSANLTAGEECAMDDSMMAVGAGLVIQASSSVGSSSQPDQGVVGLSAAFAEQRNEVWSSFSSAMFPVVVL